MKYTELVEKLQKQEKNRIIMVKCGAFFVALGKDAIILNRLLGLRLNCQKDKLCKVGVPLQSILKYVDELENIGYSFSIYDYSKENKQASLEYNFDGKEITVTENCLDCSKCEGYNPWKDEDQRNIYIILTERQKKDGKGTTTDTKI